LTLNLFLPHKKFSYVNCQKDYENSPASRGGIKLSCNSLAQVLAAHFQIRPWITTESGGRKSMVGIGLASLTGLAFSCAYQTGLPLSYRFPGILAYPQVINMFVSNLAKIADR
jgi:hypothetical protein